MKTAPRLPASLWVYVNVAPTKRNGLKKALFKRVGTAKDLDDAKRIEREDRKAMCNTYGGLISAPGDAGREYFVFKATWEQVA